MRKPKGQRKRKGNAPNFYKTISKQELESVDRFFKAQLVGETILRILEKKSCQP